MLLLTVSTTQAARNKPVLERRKKETLTMENKLRFAFITNNGYDTLAIVKGTKVVSEWMVTPEVVTDYLTDTDPYDWDLNYPDCEKISDYGDEVTGDKLQARINFHLDLD